MEGDGMGDGNRDENGKGSNDSNDINKDNRDNRDNKGGSNKEKGMIDKGERKGDKNNIKSIAD